MEMINTSINNECLFRSKRILVIDICKAKCMTNLLLLTFVSVHLYWNTSDEFGYVKGVSVQDDNGLFLATVNI